MKLSIAMIVKNEENNLDRTLKALSCLNNRINYEIIIVDTGSTDKTIDIAKKYTDRVYEHKWTGNFAEMRNISIKYCTGEWVLILDADEVLEDVDKVIEFLESEKAELFNSATVSIKNYDRKSEAVSTEASLVRLLKNRKDLKYIGRVHEQPDYKLPLAHSAIVFKHYGYCMDDSELMNYKFKRNEGLLKEDLKTAKGENKIYVLYQLSKTYSMANMADKALEYIKKAYELELNYKGGGTHTYVYHWYATILFNRKEYKKAVNICEAVEKVIDGNLDVYYILCTSYSELGKYKTAYKYYDKYFELRNERKNGYTSDDLSLSEGAYGYVYRVLSNRMLCYYNEKKYDKVISEFEKYDSEKLEKEVEKAYIISCIVSGKLSNLVDYYSEKDLTDIDVEKIIYNFNVTKYDYDYNIEETMKVLSALDKRIKIYFDSEEDKISDEARKIGFSNCLLWKAEVLKKLVIDDVNNIELLKGEDNEIVKYYTAKVFKSFECLDLVYEYTKKKFLSTDIEELNFICDLENVLIFDDAIVYKKRKDLIFRILVNKANYRKMVYNTELISNNQLRMVLEQYDRVLLDIENELKLYPQGKVEYLKKMGDIMRINDKYSLIIKPLIGEVSDKPISSDMVKEKENIFMAVENLISNNKIEEAEDVLKQLESLFQFDGKIYAYKGIINYIKEEYDDALENLGASTLLLDDKFDAIFNIACVLEKQNRVEDCIKYYEEAYKICIDDNMKMQIKEILQGLK